MFAALFLSALLLAIGAGEAVARRMEARTAEPPAAAAKPRDCILIGYASVESITTEGMPRGRDLTGAGFVHVATLRNRLTRPLQLKVTFGAPDATDATRDGCYVIAPRGILRVRLGVTPARPTDRELRSTVSVQCEA